MKNSKTVQQWLQSAPEEWKELALKYLSANAAQIPAKSLSDAIDKAFDWEKTEEDNQFWALIYKQIKRKEEIISILTKCRRKWRKAALDNATNKKLHLTYYAPPSDLLDALNSFNWSSSPEGFEFWYKIYRETEKEFIK